MEIKWDKKTHQQVDMPHPDYNINLKGVEDFVNNNKDRMLKGMYFGLKRISEYSKSLFLIGWRAPINAKTGSFCAPIFLHRPMQEVDRVIRNAWSDYLHLVKDFYEKNPEFLTSDKSVEAGKIPSLETSRSPDGYLLLSPQPVQQNLF